jgi:hypothetical protein
MYQEPRVTWQTLVVQYTSLLLVVQSLGKFFLQECGLRWVVGPFQSIFRVYQSHSILFIYTHKHVLIVLEYSLIKGAKKPKCFWPYPTLFFLVASFKWVELHRGMTRGTIVYRSHVRNWLTAQTTWALLCVGLWSCLGLVKDKNIHSVASLPDVDGKEEELNDGWDSITLA